jgi:hypothetical protein
MINKEELDKMDMPTLEKEMKSRRALREQMVGWLYPSILTDEIAQLAERHAELQLKAV